MLTEAYVLPRPGQETEEGRFPSQVERVVFPSGRSYPMVNPFPTLGELVRELRGKDMIWFAASTFGVPIVAYYRNKCNAWGG